MALGDVTPSYGSVSTSGRMIAVAATATPGTLLHTAVAGTDEIDSVSLYAVNIDSIARSVTLEIGGTSTSDTCPVTIQPTEGLSLIARGIRLNGGVALRAFASVANKINIVVCVDTFDLT